MDIIYRARVLICGVMVCARNWLASKQAREDVLCPKRPAGALTSRRRLATVSIRSTEYVGTTGMYHKAEDV